MQAIGQDLPEERQKSWKQWLGQYKTVLKSEGQSNEQRIQQQNSANPCYIPRNHLLQKAIEKAEDRDFSEVQCIQCSMHCSTGVASLRHALILWYHGHFRYTCGAQADNKFASHM